MDEGFLPGRVLVLVNRAFEVHVKQLVKAGLEVATFFARLRCRLIMPFYWLNVVVDLFVLSGQPVTYFKTMDLKSVQ